MSGEDTPAQHKSSDTATGADLQPIQKFALTGAGVVEGLTCEHDDAPDALEGAVQLARSSAQAGARPFLVGRGGC